MSLKNTIKAARLQRKLRVSVLKNEIKSILENVVKYEEAYGSDLEKFPSEEAELFLHWIKRANAIHEEKKRLVEAIELDKMYDDIQTEIDSILSEGK